MKTCTKCKAEKQKTDFHNDARTHDLLYSQCKECVKARNSKRYLESIENNRLRSRNYKAKNPEKSKESCKEWKLKNKERVSLSSAEWRSKNSEHMSYLCKKWRSNNREKVLSYNRTRKALLSGAEGSHTAAEVRVIFEKQNGLCANCRANLFKSGVNKYHVDHIMPLARGGANSRENLQCLCPSCNLRKHAKDPIRWANENGRLL